MLTMEVKGARADDTKAKKEVVLEFEWKATREPTKGAVVLGDDAGSISDIKAVKKGFGHIHTMSRHLVPKTKSTSYVMRLLKNVLIMACLQLIPLAYALLDEPFSNEPIIVKVCFI